MARLSHALGGSWMGRGTDRIYTRCDPEAATLADEGIAPGAHTVQMVAHLPGTDLELRTHPADFHLDCVAPDCESRAYVSVPGCPPSEPCPYSYDPHVGRCVEPPLDCIEGYPDSETGTCRVPPTGCPDGGAGAGVCGGDGEPPAGFEDDVRTGSCSVAPGTPGGGLPVGAMALALLGGAAALRRRRH